MHDIVKSFNTDRVQSCYLNSRYYVLFGATYAKCNTLACISYIRLRQISNSRLVHISSNCLVLLAKEETVLQCVIDRVTETEDIMEWRCISEYQIWWESEATIRNTEYDQETNAECGILQLFGKHGN